MTPTEFKINIRNYQLIKREIADLMDILEMKEHGLVYGLKRSYPMTEEQKSSPLPPPKGHGPGVSLVVRFDSKDKVELSLHLYEELIRRMDIILAMMDGEDRRLIWRHYVERESINAIALEQGTYVMKLHRQIDRAIESACRKYDELR